MKTLNLCDFNKWRFYCCAQKQTKSELHWKIGMILIKWLETTKTFLMFCFFCRLSNTQFSNQHKHTQSQLLLLLLLTMIDDVIIPDSPKPICLCNDRIQSNYRQLNWDNLWQPSGFLVYSRAMHRPTTRLPLYLHLLYRQHLSTPIFYKNILQKPETICKICEYFHVNNIHIRWNITFTSSWLSFESSLTSVLTTSGLMPTSLMQSATTALTFSCCFGVNYPWEWW